MGVKWKFSRRGQQESTWLHYGYNFSGPTTFRASLFMVLLSKRKMAER
jgi:hypothetical protein